MAKEDRELPDLAATESEPFDDIRMKLRIHSLKNQGDASKEYIALEAVEDCGLSNYAVVDTTFTAEGTVSNRWRHFHKFQPQALKAGDIVVLYTRKGQSETRNFERHDLKRTVKVYDRFWGSDSPLWNDGEECAALYFITLVDSKKKK